MPYDRMPRNFWIDVVDEFERSDLTQARFASERKLNFSTFKSWLYRLRKEREQLQEALDPPRFFEVTPSGTTDTTKKSSPLCIKMGTQVVIEFAELPSPAYLAALACALEGGTC